MCCQHWAKKDGCHSHYHAPFGTFFTALLSAIMSASTFAFVALAAASTGAQVAQAETNGTTTTAPTFDVAESFVNIEGGSKNLGTKPVLYVNNPQLLKEMQQQTFLRHNFRLTAGVNNEGDSEESKMMSGSVQLLQSAKSLAHQLRLIANHELGVTELQASFDELPYSDLEHQEKSTLEKMITTLENKMRFFETLLLEMSEVVSSHNRDIEVQSKEMFFGFRLQEVDYHPCCLLPDHYFVYRSHFGTRVNEDMWCDSGFGSGELLPHPHRFYIPSYNLTELFGQNLRRYPTLKWQYFMSSEGLHTEYPAHRLGTNMGSDCGQSSRHRIVYEATVRPQGRNIVILFDLGRSLTPRLLQTAKAIGHYILSTASNKDHMAILSVAGKTVTQPSAPCMKSSLVKATHDMRLIMRNFIDYMDIQDETSNHILGLSSALNVIESWSSNHTLSATSSALLLYVTPGQIQSDSEAEQTLMMVDNKLNDMSTRVVISTVGLAIDESVQNLHYQFLTSLVNQDLNTINAQKLKISARGQVVRIGPTLSIAPFLHNFYDVVEEPRQKAPHFGEKWEKEKEEEKKENEKDSENNLKNGQKKPGIIISQPYWDEDTHGMVVSFSLAIWKSNGSLLGVVGLDVSLADLLEDVTHYNSPDKSHALAVTAKGHILGHPKLGRPEMWTLPLLKTNIELVESSPGVDKVRPLILEKPFGHEIVNQSSGTSKQEFHYWWLRSHVCGWVFCIISKRGELPHKRLSRSVPPISASFLFHRLDLVSFNEAKVCRHFNQFSTLDAATLFLAVGAYVSPLSQLASGPQTPTAVQSIKAYLTDTTQLIGNPGLRPGVRMDVAAVYPITHIWKKQATDSDLTKFIVRRYLGMPSGVTFMYPGTLLDRSYDPRAQTWYINALKSPGKVVVSAPRLDPGGAGHIVTVSHTVYQGLSAALHSPDDPVVAVFAADFTLGYWYKLLLEMEPQCQQTNIKQSFGQSNAGPEEDTGGNIRCFLMDTEGYLVAHPAMMDPLTSPPNPSATSASLPRHITHQEPLVSMELLSIGSNLVWKRSCGRWWHGSTERHYAFNLEPGQILTTPFMESQVDGGCLHYALTAINKTNLIFGMINQTCNKATAFCPCSMVDRLCLNCQLVEAGACECPCECPLPLEACHNSTEDGFMNSRQSSTITQTNNSPSLLRRKSLQTYSEPHELEPQSLASSWPIPKPPYGQLSAPTCSRTPEFSSPLQYSMILLGQLQPCISVSCSVHIGMATCLGVVGCVWCTVGPDKHSPLPTPRCLQVHECHGGILGGPSPYPNGLATLPISDNSPVFGSTPIGPVAGGIMALFLLMAIAVYCYRQHVGSAASSSNLYTPSQLQYTTPQNMQNYHTDTTNHRDNADEELLGAMNGVIGVGAAAAISPYRMNPGYRRPPGQNPDSSDHGYSTMTPHEDSENLNYTDLGGLAVVPSSSNLIDESLGTNGWSSSHRSSPLTTHQALNGVKDNNIDGENYCFTQLDEPKTNGPKKFIVPVTVHMVDTV